MLPTNKKPKVVIIGAGFGGLWAARTLAHKPVEVTVIDRNNCHTFLALLYQVAAADSMRKILLIPCAASSGNTQHPCVRRFHEADHVKK